MSTTTLVSGRLESGGGEGATVAAGHNHLTSQDGMTLGM
jgi:hypothetical protein